MGKWFDDSACWVVHEVRLYSVLDTVVISGDDVCCSLVFGILVGVFVFSVMWSELLMTSAISCSLWSSVYECQRVQWTFTSPVRNECGMFDWFNMVLHYNLNHLIFTTINTTLNIILNITLNIILSITLNKPQTTRFDVLSEIYLHLLLSR